MLAVVFISAHPRVRLAMGAAVTVAGQVFYHTDNKLQELLHMNNGKGLSGSVRGEKGNANGFFCLQFLGFISKDFTLTNWLHLKAQ